MKRILNYAESKYSTGWEMRVDSTRNRLGFASQYETTYSTVWNSAGAWQFSKPAGTTLADGLRVDYEYDTTGFTNKILFGDGTYETSQYNDLHQVTRHRDRSARVTKYTYDARGNRLTKEVGILEVTTTTGGASPVSASVNSRCGTSLNWMAISVTCFCKCLPERR